jgi:hypothetical protein
VSNSGNYIGQGFDPLTLHHANYCKAASNPFAGSISQKKKGGIVRAQTRQIYVLAGRMPLRGVIGFDGIQVWGYDGSTTITGKIIAFNTELRKAA